MSPKHYLCVLFLLLVVAQTAHCWGPQGHRITAYIASKLVSLSTLLAAQAVLSPSEDFVKSATWADVIKSDPDFDWAYNLHFINQLKDWECKINLPVDCSDTICVPFAIANYTSILRLRHDVIQPSREPSGGGSVGRIDGGPLDQALKFLIHFSGDIHQPLHAGFLRDLGGNSFNGTFNGIETNLHKLWDENIIDLKLKSYNDSEEAYGEALLSRIAGEWSADAIAWSACSDKFQTMKCPGDWTQESAALSCQYSYVNADGLSHIESDFVLGAAYSDRNSPVIDLQLAKGGVRLAALLNAIF